MIVCVLFVLFSSSWYHQTCLCIYINLTTPCLHIFIHRCITMLVFLSRPFSLDHFDDYQKHYTVMNYAKDVQLKQVQKLCLGYMLRSVRLILDDLDVFVSHQIHYDEFIPMFESQYPQYPWKQVEVWFYALQILWNNILRIGYTYTDLIHSFLFVSYTVFPLQVSLPNSSVYERFKVPLQSIIVSNKTHLW